MKVSTQRWVDRWLGVPLCRLLSLLPAPGGGPLDAGHPPRRILVVLLSEMGSLVLATPMLRRLQEKYPGVALYALVFRRNAEVVSLLEAIPPEHVLTLRNDGLVSLLGDALAAVSRLRRLKLDVVIDCELFSRVSALLSRLTGAPVHVGFHRHRQEGLYRGSFITRPVLYNPYQHIARQFVTLAEAIEARGMPRVKRSSSEDVLTLEPLDLSEGELPAMRERLARDFPNLDLDSGRLVLLYAGGGLLPIRAWPLESFQRLAVRLSEAGFTVGVVGLTVDRPLARSIVEAVGERAAVDLTGYTATVRELMVLFHLAELLVTNDGGPGHFAARTPIASIILFGPETPLLYGSLDPKAVCLTRSLSCSPCLTAYNHRDSPCDGDNQCLKSIEVEEVFDRAMALLGRESAARSS